MKKAVSVAGLVMLILFMMCGTLGYAAFGDKTPENLLAGFGDDVAFWLVDMANVFIVVHIVGAYQVHILYIYLFPKFMLLKCAQTRRQQYHVRRFYFAR